MSCLSNYRGILGSQIQEIQGWDQITDFLKLTHTASKPIPLDLFSLRLGAKEKLIHHYSLKNKSCCVWFPTPWRYDLKKSNYTAQTFTSTEICMILQGKMLKNHSGSITDKRYYHASVEWRAESGNLESSGR